MSVTNMNHSLPSYTVNVQQDHLIKKKKKSEYIALCRDNSCTYTGQDDRKRNLKEVFQTLLKITWSKECII